MSDVTYKMTVGFERYTETFTISEIVFKKYFEKDIDLSYAGSLKVRTSGEVLIFKRDEIRFIRVYKG